ncbi:DUF421 domain-containing protein [Lysinibacillus sp. SGAir0095]|uniref:DUF421 domain-containing protein n=1 Tax=Lysinibacillus sp. SGAir0095 TaxID=2070463 RepID=UPI001F0F57DC|nr:YetF domain-containing protein [Lysinibacillus sp. SGAir0095]
MYVGIAIKFLVALVCIVIVIRIIGQKELSQTTPIDLVFMLILADIIGGMIHGKEFNFSHIIFFVIIWGFFMWGAERLTQKKNFERWIDGKPEIIIKNGTVNSQLMKKENLTMQELETQLRKQGVFNIQEVRLGILEIDGSISVDLSRKDCERN